MAESFTNSLKNSVGLATSKTAATIAAGSTIISNIDITDVQVGDMVITQFFRGGAKVVYKGPDAVLGANEVSLAKTSTNDVAATNQFVEFMGVQTCFTAPNKSIFVGGTFANLSNNGVDLSVEVGIGDTFALLVSEVPIPAGSSFVLNETGKTVLRTNEELRIYTDADEALSVSLSILTGVS